MALSQDLKRELRFSVLLFVFLVAALFTAHYLTKPTSIPPRTGLYGVFLSSGQVYFGAITKEDGDRLVLNNIFYLQAQKTGTQSDAQLLKLGNELHGPEDYMEVNRSQILFIEKLKEDGKVAKAIREYKK